MYIKDIQRFEDNRYRARAYMSYILTRNLPNKLVRGILKKYVTIFKQF
ncbi:TPA: hypothetical protein RTG88_001113 [Campylobacter jejuni]|nr:hypothetical protein [Campylobacter jejuni]